MPRTTLSNSPSGPFAACALLAPEAVFRPTRRAAVTSHERGISSHPSRQPMSSIPRSASLSIRGSHKCGFSQSWERSLADDDPVDRLLI
jgi:hypothetical protein